MLKESQRWVGYLHEVKIFQSTDNARRQEALDEMRETNRVVIDAFQEMRFPIRVLRDPQHSNVFVRSCIQAFCDADMSADISEVRFPFLKFAQIESSNRISEAPICVWWCGWQHGAGRCMGISGKYVCHSFIINESYKCTCLDACVQTCLCVCVCVFVCLRIWTHLEAFGRQITLSVAPSRTECKSLFKI